jgi:hypothetical protein
VAGLTSDLFWIALIVSSSRVSTSICLKGPLIVIRSPSKLSSQLSFSALEGPSIEAKDLSLSEENNPPKLSCGLRCGSCRALGDIEVAKSSSQLSSSFFMSAHLNGEREVILPILSGDRNASAVFLGLARINGPFAGVAKADDCCSLCTFRNEGTLLTGSGLLALDREARKDPLFGDFRASFHCLTSSTASLKFAGGFETGASLRREPTIHACLGLFENIALKSPVQPMTFSNASMYHTHFLDSQVKPLREGVGDHH